jgi:hypothetical protein
VTENSRVGRRERVRRGRTRSRSILTISSRLLMSPVLFIPIYQYRLLFATHQPLYRLPPQPLVTSFSVSSFRGLLFR